MVPIVLGAYKEDYVSTLPPHSYINVDDFRSIRDLAAYLKYLDRNDTAYAAYFAWRQFGELTVSFHAYSLSKKDNKIFFVPCREFIGLIVGSVVLLTNSETAEWGWWRNHSDITPTRVASVSTALFYLWGEQTSILVETQNVFNNKHSLFCPFSAFAAWAWVMALISYSFHGVNLRSLQFRSKPHVIVVMVHCATKRVSFFTYSEKCNTNSFP